MVAEHKPPDFGGLGAERSLVHRPGAEAFKRDLPDVEIHLREKNDDIASLVLAFLAKHSV